MTFPYALVESLAEADAADTNPRRARRWGDLGEESAASLTARRWQECLDAIR